MRKKINVIFITLSLGSLILLQGCIILPILPVILSGIGSAAGYAILNTAYRTEIYSEKDVLRNSIRALNKMGFVILETKHSSNSEWQIFAETTERRIAIELERITPKTTKVTVNVIEGSIIKDKATAEAIIDEVELLLKTEEKNKQKAQTAFLFIKTKPEGMTIKIMNIVPTFHQGIELKPGSYQLRIESEQYVTRSMRIKLKPYEERFLEIAMKKRKK